MADDLGLRPLYLLLFTAGIGILVALALDIRAETKAGEVQSSSAEHGAVHISASR